MNDPECKSTFRDRPECQVRPHPKILTIVALLCFVFGGLSEAKGASPASWTQYPKTEFPKPVGYVNDFANIIPEKTRQDLESLCREVEQKTGAEIALVTVETVGDEHPDEYANKLFETWGIGKKGKDNGVLLFNAVKERRLRIEVGYGLEGILPDGIAGDILRDYVVPHYRKYHYGEGLLAGTRAIAGVIAKDAGIEITGSISVQRRQADRSADIKSYGKVQRRQGNRSDDVLGILAFIFFIIFFIIIALNRGNWGNGSDGGWYDGGGGGGGWGGGGGSFGGDFGGFGGGGSGGGGAGASY